MNRSKRHEKNSIYEALKSAEPPKFSKKNKTIKFEGAKKIKYFGYIAAFLLTGMLVISRVVRANVMLMRANSAKREYETLASENCRMRFEIAKELERMDVEKIARTELKMVRPEPYQIIYVDVPESESESGESAKITARLLASLKALKTGIRSLF